jgi:tRNA uridine 5-carboxymethylaminomethyl modification enzyme
MNQYDIIVVGGGHAGCEAAHAAAKMGSKTLLITMNMQVIGQMSCNPAMGGVAKGQIVREIDALGGLSGIITDKSAIQFRMLNLSKGPAMWSPRTQNDRMLFAQYWRLALEQTPNLNMWQDMVNSLIIENNKVVGVNTGMGIKFYAKAVVLTNGTFLNGIMHIGEKQIGGGRMGEKAAQGITEQLVSLGFQAGRMKTGTPPRIDGRSLDYSKMQEQLGDEKPSKFSYLPDTQPLQRQRSCWITYTNDTVHDILRTGFEKSPMFTGRIQGLGPRYCPSIEDKINRFADKERHQIFVEPEGWETVEIYVNGFSTSLPYEVQQKAIQQIPGFEKAKMYRPGYAVEYDYFPPTQLYLTLETKLIENLYFAGQINGTTGYEEAACQGLIAGMNAHLKINEKEEFVPSRADAYIGVLIDDLVNKGTEEPYRMFTSRAEYRLLLRQDNADLRLTAVGHQLGLADDRRMWLVEKKQQDTKMLLEVLDKIKYTPDEATNECLESFETATIREKVTATQLLKRPNVEIHHLEKLSEDARQQLMAFDEEARMQATVHVKYDTYIEKERQMAQKMKELEYFKIKADMDYFKLNALSMEAREKLSKNKPATIGQATRISGVSPADISILMIHLGIR